MLLFGWYPATSAEQRPDGRFQPVAVVALGEQVRGDVMSTVSWFAEQGVTLKVLSGDEPTTVGAVAEAVGIEGSDHPMNARDLPDADPVAYANIAPGDATSSVESDPTRSSRSSPRCSNTATRWG